MTLLAPFARRLALEVVGPVPAATPSPPSPRPPPPGTERPLVRSGSAGARLRVARFLAHTLLTDARSVRAVVGELEASVDERVVVWSPCLHTTSRTELVNALLDSDDAVSGIEVAIVREAAAGASVFVEWHVSGRFLGPGILNDEVLVEPSGATVESSGALVVDFDDRRATRVCCFHDGLGLLEQVLAPPPRS
jgi:hypothetical protein